MSSGIGLVSSYVGCGRFVGSGVGFGVLCIGIYWVVGFGW